MLFLLESVYMESFIKDLLTRIDYKNTQDLGTEMS